MKIPLQPPTRVVQAIRCAYAQDIEIEPPSLTARRVATHYLKMANVAAAMMDVLANAPDRELRGDFAIHQLVFFAQEFQEAFGVLPPWVKEGGES